MVTCEFPIEEEVQDAALSRWCALWFFGISWDPNKPSALTVTLQLSNFALSSNVIVLFVFVVVAMETNMRDYFQSNHIFIMHSLGSNPILLKKVNPTGTEMERRYRLVFEGGKIKQIRTLLSRKQKMRFWHKPITLRLLWRRWVHNESMYALYTFLSRHNNSQH